MSIPPPEEQRTPAYPETADIETSSDDYATRFSGPVGGWMLKVQERITLKMLDGATSERILDVGGGHGQLAIPLVREGYEVTVLGSDPACCKRIHQIVEGGQCRFLVGNVIELPFEDHAFDTVLAFRMVTHCQRWPELIAELTRVAKTRVIVDYPTSQSVNAIAPALFNAKKRVEVNTRTWTLFRHDQITEAFAQHGFWQHRRRGQFFFPMVLHRMMRVRSISSALEASARALGLTALWGSPVIAEWRPRDTGSD